MTPLFRSSPAQTLRRLRWGNVASLRRVPDNEQMETFQMSRSSRFDTLWHTISSRSGCWAKVFPWCLAARNVSQGERWLPDSWIDASPGGSGLAQTKQLAIYLC